MVSYSWSPCYSSVAGVLGVFADAFDHVVAGGPAVTGFSAVAGVPDLVSVPADPGVPILAGIFKYWAVH
jgi:hypothetical protein